jgi:hypothetical protein
MGLPRRLMVILEGEELANDATALVLYRFAVTAVAVGSFSLSEAAGTLAAIIVGEIIWGIGRGRANTSRAHCRSNTHCVLSTTAVNTWRDGGCRSLRINDVEKNCHRFVAT